MGPNYKMYQHDVTPIKFLRKFIVQEVYCSRSLLFKKFIVQEVYCLGWRRLGPISSPSDKGGEYKI